MMDSRKLPGLARLANTWWEKLELKEYKIKNGKNSKTFNGGVKGKIYKKIQNYAYPMLASLTIISLPCHHWW
jgi:hypothetical protein